MPRRICRSNAWLDEITCMKRGLVTFVPGAPTTEPPALGLFQRGELNRLKTSNLASIFRAPPSAKFRNSEKSKLVKPGPI
jgi:hypothetical protein